MSKEECEKSSKKDVFLKIVERFEKFESKSTRYRIASEEFLATLKDNKPKFVTERLILTLAGSKGNLADEYNSKGKDTKYLVSESKLLCLEILRNEWVEN